MLNKTPPWVSSPGVRGPPGGHRVAIVLFIQPAGGGRSVHSACVFYISSLLSLGVLGVGGRLYSGANSDIL